MDYDLMAKLFCTTLTGLIKPSIKDKLILTNIKNEYKRIVLRAKDIGSGNMLISSYLLAAYFIAMNREAKISPHENFLILENALRSSKMLKLMLGNKNAYFSEKKMEKRREWARDSEKRKYENDWVVKVVEGNDDFVFGLDYKECGVCKLCQDEGVPELAKYLCKLDFMLVEIIGIRLIRTKTLADGDEVCDFRFKG